MKEKPETKLCKHCKTEIPYDAKVCPNCRKKQGLPTILVILIVLVVIGAIGTAFGNDDIENAPTTTAQKETVNVPEEVKEYIPISVAELNAALKENPLKAKEDYNGKYLEVSGVLGTIDSDGKYFGLDDGSFDLYGVHCDIMNDEQKTYIANCSKGANLTVRLKVTDVGEILSYMANVIEFVD